MIKELKYTEYSANPSAYECVDGELDMSLGVINEDGSMKPLLPPSVVCQLPDNCKVVYIHKTSSFEHYIIQNTSTNYLYWIDSTMTSATLTTTNQIGNSNYYNISHVNAIGNTLMIFTSTAIFYVLWKSDNYNVLGNQLPEIAINFGLVGHPRLYSLVTEDGNSSKRGTFSISFNGIGKNDLYNTFSDENKTKITSQVMAKVNKFIAEQTINKGRFCFPFFVRWAYRLFDGSHMMHSAPILMTPSTTPAPIVLWKRATGKNSYTDAECDIMMVAADLDYSLVRHGNYYDLEDWQDIISGIDIYISKPIYTYDQNGEFTSFNDEDNMECKFIGKLYNGEKDKDTPDTTLASDITEDRMLSPLSDTDFMSKYLEWTYTHIYALYFAKDRKVPNTTLHMPEFSDDKRDESIEGNVNFYKLASLDINELEVATRKTIPIKEDYLQSLVNREVMTDDYLTHDRLMATSSYNFNSRLNLSGVKRELFSGFISNSLFSFCQNVYSFGINTSTKAVTISMGVFDNGNMHMRIYIRENGEVYYVENEPFYYAPYLRCFVNTSNWQLTTLLSDDSKRVTTYDFSAGTKTVTKYDSSGNVTSTETFNNRYKPTAWGAWLFYPNSNAFKIAIYENSQLVFVADLKAHDFLNGAYAFLGFKSERGNSSTVGTLPSISNSSSFQDGAIVDVPNKIYTSEVNNPFFFPLLGINTVGNGKILGMSSANKALSQGQFGQFPLYAFTTDGVWALEVSSTGTYSAKQPITRDVCISPNSITQLDSAVLFATDRGIMHICGSTVQCISDKLNTAEIFDIANLPKSDKLIDVFNRKADEDKQATLSDLTLQPFQNFLKGCRMVYDYTNQHIIVYNPNIRYAYVYSLKSQSWGMMQSDIVDNVNSYPEALAMADGAKLVDFSTSEANSIPALIITRPFKLDDPNAFKTINTIIQRGLFHSSHVSQVLYGSNDLYNWHAVWSSVDRIMRGFRGTPYKAYRLALICKFDKAECIYGCSITYEPRMTNQIR